MLRYASHSDIGIERIAPWAEYKLQTRARQISHLMAWVHDFYMRPKEEGGLGLVRLDNEDPPGSPGDIDWRIPKLQKSGPVQETKLEFIGAFELDQRIRISNADTALRGLLVATKPDGICTPSTSDSLTVHRPTEILELDSTMPGLARVMLHQVDIHPDDLVTLDVVRGNDRAIGIYEHYGFRRTEADPMKHGVFDVKHLPMAVPGDIFLENLYRTQLELLP
jgi:hypothetical protein